ncbi:Signal transduction histidine kinase [Parapedobacter composti]|uniref:histidine kinase n=1 Tax=Parapedobacter composti TaxID=623281 RepID=A0A1I1EUB8_9SPHI|nr:sensor histidine kinase [Parapedobacter composti]SFB90694.1 Signal transduction histidine kinase [Parapedobacter composti]
MRLNVLIYLLCLFVSCGYVHGQPYYFSHYQVEDGLSNNGVLCSAQDRMGFMWFGTKDGLNRFDGYSFKVFQHDPNNPNGLGSNFIRALFVDQTGIIWVGTDQGVYLFNPVTETFSLFHPTVTNEILGIQGDFSGNIWIIDNLTLYGYIPGIDSLAQVSDLPRSAVSSFGIAETGDIWIGTSQGDLIHYRPAQGILNTYSLYDHSPPVTSRWIERVYCVNKQFILVGTTKQGVKLVDIAGRTYTDLLPHDETGTDIFVRDILQNGENEYWFATEQGIFIYDQGTGQHTAIRKQRADPWALSDNAVYTLCKDREGAIWAGTYFGGINYYAEDNTFFEKFFPLTEGQAIAGNAVREICGDNMGNIWIGTEDEGLTKLETATGRITNFQPDGKHGSLAYANIHGLLATGDTLWVGTFDHGLDLLDIPTGKVIKHYRAENKEGALRNNFIFTMYRTREGRILLATGRGLYQYAAADKRFTRVPEFPNYIFYTALFEDSDGTIWAGTWRDGLYYSNPKTGKHGKFIHDPAVPASLASNRVNRIYEDSHATVWVATEGGLCRLNPRDSTFRRYGIAQGFPGNLILAMLEDDVGNLWVTTSKGLVQLNRTTEAIRVFTKANGLLSDQFNYNSAYKAPDGTLYFGSVKGMIRFNPANYREQTYQPPVYITGLQVYNRELEINSPGSPLTQSITFTDHIELQYNQSSFSIDFAALSFVSPGMTEYSYKMEGLDKEWTHIRTNRKAYFTELPPGDYLFRVNVADSQGGFKGKERQLRITIMPPFWASFPAYVLYIVLITALIWYIIRSYHRRIRERNRRKLELMRHRKEEELYRAKIDFFTNVTHEIRTPLTLIKAPLEKVMKKAEELPTVKRHLQTMERNTERLIELIDRLLDFRKTEVTGYQLNFSAIDIHELLRENHMGFKLAAAQKNIRLKLTLPDTPCIAYVDKEAVTQIIGNLLTNGLKYAERIIHITLHELSSSDSQFTISIRNDGYLIPWDMRDKVFETFVRLKATNHQQGAGLGLALARSLAQLHNGELYLATPEDGMNVFVLKLPLKQHRNKTQYGTGIVKI